MPQTPAYYSEKEIDCLEAHITAHFGAFDNVFHELVSTDIHVDIAVIKPTKARPHYTLVTMGMGARRMNVPPDLREKRLSRAELLVTLPPDWEIDLRDDEKWYWPIRWLKILARFPGEEDTWLGWGHSVPNGEPFADNTRLSNVLLDMPYFFGEDSQVCRLPDGDEVNFYQLVPLYDEEVDYKIQHGTEALADLFPDTFDMVVDVARESVCGAGAADSTDEIRPLLSDWDGPQECIASDRIMVDGQKVGYLYREAPDDPEDSGWRFLAGDESDDYMDNPDNAGLYDLNTVCNADPEIIACLNAPENTAFSRDESGQFVQVPFSNEAE